MIRQILVEVDNHFVQPYQNVYFPQGTQVPVNASSVFNMPTSVVRNFKI